MTHIKRPESGYVFGTFALSPSHHLLTGWTKLRRRKRPRDRGHILQQISFLPYFGTLLVLVGSLIFWVSSDLDILSWRHGHRTNNEIQKLQQLFPIHVNNEMEIIKHPGFQLSDPDRLAAVLDGLTIPDTIKVPTFWDPLAYGGVRQFLGENGQYLITKEEASAIGSKYQGRETIFVVVASYRDPECRPTVEDLFLRAKFPERIRVAIIDQRSSVDDDPRCGVNRQECEQNPSQPLCKYSGLIDYMEYDAQLMVGPTFARHLGHRMYRGEYFLMQVDSHIRMVTDWDEDIIQQWKSIGNEMAVLSTYLSDITNSIDPVSHQSLRESRAIMCNAEFDWKGNSKEHIKFNVQPTNKPRIESSPMLHPFWAAGFSFARGHFGVQVRYDPHLPFVFQGEEISMTIRGFTYGYDFYAPIRNVAYHIYAIRQNRENRLNVRTFTENAALFPGAKEQAYHRLNKIMGLGKSSIDYDHSEESMYGLGRVRTADKFYRTFGIHVDKSEIEKGLCDFVQGVRGYPSMHEEFSPFLRRDGMGINYSKIKFEHKEKPMIDSPVNPEELASLRRRVRDLAVPST